jgi:hypothetical protein
MGIVMDYSKVRRALYVKSVKAITVITEVEHAQF